MIPTINLECSKKIYELLGDYETEQVETEKVDEYCICGGEHDAAYTYTPKPNLGELIRLLPKIGENDEYWHFEYLPVCPECGMGQQDDSCEHEPMHEDSLDRFAYLTKLYMQAPSPEQGMEEVSKYLMSIL